MYDYVQETADKSLIIMSQSEGEPPLPLNVPTVLITGAFSGLGRAFFEHFAAATHNEEKEESFSSPNRQLTDFRVVGIDRQPWPGRDGKPQPSHAHGPRSVYVQADITSPRRDLEALARRWVGADTPIPLVIHSAGVRGLVPGIEIRGSGDVAGAEGLDAMDAATMMGTFEVNTAGALNVVAAVLPNLRLAAGAGLRPRVVAMSSRMGSAASNAGGGAYAYRASKAALNAVFKSLSVDVPEVCFALVHPGRVETGLVSVREDGAMTCEESLKGMLPLLDRLGEGHLRSGCFVDRFGVEIPW